MPIKDEPPAGGSAKQQLVPVGKRDVFAKSQLKEGKQEKASKPTTERALILRNGKYGARGTGELMLMSRMSGREKMDLLAGMYPCLEIVARLTWSAPQCRESCRGIQESCFKSLSHRKVFKNCRISGRW